jgi:hypothetical protein
MAHARNGHIRLLALGWLLTLAGCVDMFTASGAPEIARWQGTTQPAPEVVGRVPVSDAMPGVTVATIWRGTSTAGKPGVAGCDPLAFDVTVHGDPLSVPAVVNGRAYPTTAPQDTRQRLEAAVTSWWVEGYQNVDSFMQFESKLQRPVFFRARPYSVWRGAQSGEHIVLSESGSPCGRDLVLTRG